MVGSGVAVRFRMLVWPNGGSTLDDVEADLDAQGVRSERVCVDPDSLEPAVGEPNALNLAGWEIG